MDAATSPGDGDETEHAARRITDSKLARGLGLLRTFRGGETELMLKQLTVRTGLATGTAHRLTWELADLGMLDRVTGGFRPGAAIARLALRATTWPVLTAAAGPAAERLHGLSGCPVTLYVPSGAGLLPMWRLESRQGVLRYQPVPPTEVDPSPLLPTLRLRHATERWESALLAPIRDGSGDVVAALGLTGDDGPLHRFGPALAAVAREIGGELRWAAVDDAHHAAYPASAPSSRTGSSVLARGLGLLGCLRPGERSIRRLDVVDRVATPRSTVYRCLDDLLRGGVLEEDDGRLGLGPLVRRVGPVAVAPRLPDDDGLLGLAADAGVSCWLTPIDPELGVPLNGLTLRPTAAAGGTSRRRLKEWTLVATSVAGALRTAPRRTRLRRGVVASADGLLATTVGVHHGGILSCLTAVTERARLPFVERALAELVARPALSA